MMQTKNILLLAALLLLLASCGNKTAQRTTEQTNICPAGSEQSTIYEVNIRQYTPEGTFQAFDQHLPRLKELGVEILWFMPFQPIGEEDRKGSLGSYYSIKDYTAVNPHFGTLDDFTNTVRKAHDLGMKVIIDWVANHTSRDAVWLTEGHSDWYVTDSLGRVVGPYDWTDVAKLDYSKPAMRQAMANAMTYWIEEADIDGFRCDVASEVPTDFWEATFDGLRQIKSDLFFLAEAEKPELMNKAFCAYYAWDLHHRMNALAQGKEPVDSLLACLDKMHTQFPATAIPMIFTSNHDENSWNGTEFERMGPAARTMAALSFTLPGMPLIYNGQEVGFNRRLEFFEKDSIDWNDADGFTSFYQSLIQLKKNNPALSASASFEILPTGDHPNILAFKRTAGDNTVIVVFNFNQGTVSLRNLPWSKVEEFALPAWGYKIMED